MNLFFEKSYKQMIKKAFEAKKKRGEKVTWQSMASQMRIQKTYISKVMGGEAHFSSDQLFEAGKYLGITQEESDYALLLLALERSTSVERKKTLKEKIHEIQDKQRDTSTHISTGELKKSAEDLQDYYLNPNTKLIHFFLLVRRYRKNIKLISKDLQIQEAEVRKNLEKLERLKIIEFKNGEYHPLITQFHLPKESPLCNPVQHLMKLRSMQQVQTLESKKSYTFTATFASDPETRDKILEQFFIFLKKADPEKDSGKTEPQNVYQMNFDLFPWGA